jgi:hypothetical protein
MSAVPTLAPDAALVLGIAATAIPFARTPDDEAERWLRLLRLHGEVGVALQGLGVSEGSLTSHETSAPIGVGQADGRSPNGSAGERADVIALVSERAARLADERGADGVGTRELLLGVLDVYGDVFERTLRAHGTDSDELLERLAA